MEGLVKTLALPPANLLVLAAAGLVLIRFHRRAGIALTALAVITLYALATPYVGTRLLAALETGVPTADAASPPPDIGAIVVLAGDITADAPEYGGPAPGALTLERIRYGAHLHRVTGLPILVSGGVISEVAPAGDIMRRVLTEEFGVDVRWVERESADTYQNARYSARILHADDIDTVYLVTHAWHIPRARQAFADFAITAVPAPTGYTGVSDFDLSALLPDASALRRSYFAMHEAVGRLWYRVTYRRDAAG